MKTAVFFSSPHKNGTTAQLLDSFVKSCAVGAVTVFDLYDKPPKPCIDCGKCKNVRGCAFSDLDDELSVFEESDTVVFAFPVYNNSIPAPMKALFDRFQRYYNARFCMGIKPPIEKRRKCVLLVACGREWSRAKTVLMPQLSGAFSILNLDEPEIVFTENTDNHV